MDLTQYRASTAEQQRTADLLRLMPASGDHALDIGARDGHFSLLMAERFSKVTALDLSMPQVVHPRVACVEGNAAAMTFADGAFDFVFCAEVLEHVPTAILQDVCTEIQRVASGRILIGVPYKQDIRMGQTTCQACGSVNPPWGHVNTFDEDRLAALFASCEVETISFVGETSARTNAIAATLLTYAGNPYGTYGQEEPCVHCGAALTSPSRRGPMQRVATKLGYWAQGVTDLAAQPRGNWIHMSFRRPRRG